MKELLNVLEWISIFGTAAFLAASFVGFMPRQKAYFWAVISCVLGMIVDGFQGYMGDLIVSGLLTLFWIAMWKGFGKEEGDDDSDDSAPEEKEEEELQSMSPVIPIEAQRRVGS